MRRIRVIPTLLIRNGGLVKGRNFKNHQYVGDPINAVKIFNDKEVDELCIIDISATPNKVAPKTEEIADIVSEAFMPVSYGGGITSLSQVETLFFNGIEKVLLNTAAVKTPSLITQIAKQYGNQSVVVSIDVKKNWLGKTLMYTECGNNATKLNPVEFAKQCEGLGAGEILLTNIDKEGTYSGYDQELIKQLHQSISIPIIINGGAASVSDFKTAISNGASAVAAGNLFVYQRPHNAVLISYLSAAEIQQLYS